MSLKSPVDNFKWEKIKIKKCQKLVCNFYNKKRYDAHTRTLKQALYHRLIFKKYIE